MGKFSLMVLALILLILGALWIFGPKPPVPQLNGDMRSIDLSLEELESQIQESEAAISTIKPDNEARIVWAKGYEYEKSPYSVVYLHGFSASQGEGDPIHRDFAKRYGCNLYLARLQSHGVDVAEPLMDLDAEKLMESAKHAISIGNKIGEKTLVMSTSTGGTLSLYLAASHPDLAGLICYSPNIDIKDASSELLVKPWGLQMARWVMGGKYREYEASEDEKKYWNTRYRLESLVTLKSLVKATMKEEVFQKVSSPVLLLYYFKSETEQDEVVSVSRMLEMYDQLGTPEEQKRKVALTEVGTHPFASKYTSKDIESVKRETYSFAEEVLGMQAAQTPVDTSASY